MRAHVFKVAYSLMPMVYRSTKIAIDDANHVAILLPCAYYTSHYTSRNTP